jgi:nickel/cobalt transporter (NicO) family protein
MTQPATPPAAHPVSSRSHRPASRRRGALVRRLATLVVAVVALGVTAGAAEAHPLGNFSVNHLTVVRISDDRVDVRYVLDQAEIPTFRERGLSDDAVLDRKRREVAERLELIVDGRAVALRPAGPPVLSHPAGQGGLRTTRLELPLTAPARGARSVSVRDGTFPGRVGWVAIQARPGEGTAVRTRAPATDPTGGLRRYPEDLLASPSDEREADFTVRPGTGTLAAGTGRVSSGGEARGEDGFAGLLSGDGVLVLLLLAAFGWGAVHALSPGHGKAMVAAYLVGTRGSTRDAVLLGATVTVTHTAGVIALGAVALGLSAWILPEQLYPWLTLVSGLLVVSVGAAVLRGRLRGLGHSHAHSHTHGQEHRHGHGTDGGHGHDHRHGADGGHGHGADAGRDERARRRSLLAMGASAGLIPCPSALVVLLGAVAQHRIALGLVLIVAFSAGLAATLTGLGIAVVHAGRVLARMPVPGRVAAAVPAVSAALIVVVGLVLTLQAVPQLA